MTESNTQSPYPPPIPGARPVLAVMSDLLFRSKIDEVARRLGLPLRAAKSVEQLDRHLAREVPSLAIVDLEADTFDVADAIRRLTTSAHGASVPIIAFASHTNIPAIEAGRAAGATVVLAKGGLAAQLPALLGRVAEEERAGS